jgi:PilZ domain
VVKAQTLAQLKNGNTVQLDRRAWVRYPCELDSACQPLAGTRGVEWPGKIRNLSRGGLALALARRFEVGTVLAIEMQGRDAGDLGTVLARVAHISIQPDGTWLLGCAFTKLLTEEDLKALL